VGGALYLLRTYLANRKFYLIPAIAGGYPFFGQVFEMMRGSPWDLMTDWARVYGGIFRLHLFGSTAVIISDPKLLKVVLSTKLSNFKKDVVWTYKPFLVLLGRGLVTSEGEEWRRQRKLFSHKLRIDILADIPAVSVRAVRRLSNKLEKIRGAGGGVIEMAEEFRHLTLQVITELLCSLPHDTCDQTLAHMYLPIVKEGNLRTWRPDRMYLPTPSWFKFKRDVRVLNDFLTSLITARLATRADTESLRRADILDFILDNVPPGELSIEQVRDEIKTFVLAGHETSASMLTWTLYELCQNPDILAKVRAEAEAVFGSRFNDDAYLSSVSKEQLDKLVYSQCCLKESLRKYSIVPTVVRIAEQSISVGEYFIPQGMSIMVHLQGVHHDPAYWPEPLEYRPDRFLQELEPFTFLPFIDGPRNCLGQHLSLLESKTVLALLVLRFKFTITNADAGLKHSYMVPIIPKVGHFVSVE
jgi:cytochrome P450